MTPSGGWIKIYGSLRDWEWYGDTNMVRVFLHLLLSANFRPRRLRGVEYQRGQLVTSIRGLADELNMSVQSVRTCLDRLKSTHEITHVATHAGSVITILNYDKYQGGEDESNTPNNTPGNTPLTHHQHTANTLNKNIRIEEYIILSTTTGACAREEFLTDFFSDARRGIIEALAKNLGVPPPRLRQLAEEVITEWEATATPPHKDLSDARKHLINHIRIKLKEENGSNKRYYNPNETAARRKEEFADHIGDLLSRSDDAEPDVSAYY